MRRAAMRLVPALLCFASILAHIHSEDMLFGIVGETFTFPVEIEQRIEEIIWTKNKNKVAVWERQNTPTYFTPLQNRSVLKDNGCLTIFGLEKTDSGTYKLQYWDSQRDHYLTFTLDVLDPPSKPKISWSFEGDELVLNCASDFQRPLNYSWKLNNDPQSYQGQELLIPIEKTDVVQKATCFVTFSQTEKSSEISSTDWSQEELGSVFRERNRIILIVTSVLFILSVVILLVFRHIKGRTKLQRRRLAQNNSLGHGSVLGVKTPDGDGPGKDATATFSQSVHCENEKPEAERDLNMEDSVLQASQTCNSGVNQEEVSTLQNSTQILQCADDDGLTEKEVIQGAEGGN